MALTIDDSIYINGYMEHTGSVVIESIQARPYKSGECEEDSRHPLVFYILSQSGTELYHCKVDVSFPACEGSDPCSGEDNLLFSVEAPFFDAAGSYRIVRSDDGSTVYQRDISGDIPSVSFLEYPAGTIAGKHIVTWAAQDADSDANSLIYSLWYSANNGVLDTWVSVPIGEDSTTREEVDFSRLPGSVVGSKLRVIVSDGINASDAISDTFVVSGRPPTIKIAMPTQDEVLAKNMQLKLYVAIEQPEYEKLPPENITWSSSKDGAFGHGQSLNYAGLSAGTHTITVTVNTPGGTATKTVENIVVAEKKPEIVLTVGDGTQPGLACNELKIDVVPGDAALEEVTWNGVGGDMVVVPVDQLPIRHQLKAPSSYVDVIASDIAKLWDQKEAIIPLITCPPPTPPSGG